MARRAAVCTNLLPGTVASVQYSAVLATGIYHYALWWARQIIEIETFCCPILIPIVWSKRPSDRCQFSRGESDHR